MVFVDNLAYSLFAIGFAGFLLLYVITSMYFVYRKRAKDYSAHLSAAGVPLMVIGFYIVVMALWGQFTWPLPGSYNILFYDAMVSFGLVILSFAFSIRYKVRLEYAGFFGLLVGIMTIIYGVQGYTLGLTQSPLALLALYCCYGVAGVFSYPVAIIADRFPGLKKDPWAGWYICLVIFWVAMLASSLVASYIGSQAITGHLISAP